MLADDNQNSGSSSESTQTGSDNNYYIPMRDTTEGHVRTGNSDGLITK